MNEDVYLDTMNILQMRVFWFIILLLGLASYSRGQEVPNLVWKKKVSRDIDIRDQNTRKLPRSAVNDSTISQIIVSALLAKKMAAYNYWGPPSKMTDQDVKERFLGKVAPDSEIIDGPVFDPLNPPKIRLFIADSLYKYRVYEEWNYCPSEGKMNEQITFIAPIKRIYGDDDIFRGEYAVVKLKYDELVSLLYNEKDSDLCHSLLSNIRKSNFSIDSGKVIIQSVISSRVWHAAAIALIDMQEPADTQKHFLRNENDDTLLSELIVMAVKNKEIPAWNAEEEPFSRRLTESQLDELLANKIDTFIIVDPVSKYEVTMIKARPLDYKTIQYKILEDWVHDPITGKTEITINGVAPVKITVNDSGRVTETKTMFWIHFTDLQKILNHVEQYHPENTFAMHIWERFFMADFKPVYDNY